MMLRGARDLMETESSGFQGDDDHLMSTSTTLRGDIVHIDVVDVHRADRFRDGQERGHTSFASQVTTSTSDPHHVFLCVCADKESPIPPQWHGLHDWPHLFVRLDRYRPVSLCIVNFGNSQVASFHLKLQREVISQTMVRKLIVPITNIAPGATKVNLGNVPNSRCQQKTLVRHSDAR